MTNIKVLNTETIGNGKFIKVFKDTYLQNGKERQYEYVKRDEAVAISVVKDGYMYFVKQYRHPLGKEHIALPAGLVENGEYHRETAIRELEEETGLLAKDMQFLFTLVKDAGVSNAVIHCYFTDNVVFTEQQLEETEEGLEVVKYPVSDLLSLIANGTITSSTAVSVISYLLATSKI